MNQLQKAIILGSGTSTGVPVIGCDCKVCLSPQLEDKRLRASIALTDGSNWLVIDTGPDFRLQILRAGIKSMAAILYTHTHADHCHGFDDVRAFGFKNAHPIPCYLHALHKQDFYTRFSYAFEETAYMGSKPQVEIRTIPDGKFKIGGLIVEPMVLPHGGFEVCGFRFGRFAYVTDFKGFNRQNMAKWRKKVDIMVASGIHFGRHPAHNTIPETCELFRELGVKRGIITHLSHRVSHFADQPKLPAGIEFAFDGMAIDL